jgi:phage shock protein E
MDQLPPEGDPQFADLTPAAALEYIKQHADDPRFVLLDVRTADEIAAGHIKGAVELDVYDPEFMDRLSALDREKRYVVYCRSGNRSGFAVGVMQRLGFAEAHNVSGGIKLWTEQNLPLVTG